MPDGSRFSEPERKPESPTTQQAERVASAQEMAKTIEQTLEEVAQRVTDADDLLRQRASDPFVQEVRQRARSSLDYGEVAQDSGSDVEEDWSLIKDEVLKRLQADLLDTPEAHLAYVRARLKSVANL